VVNEACPVGIMIALQPLRRLIKIFTVQPNTSESMFVDVLIYFKKYAHLTQSYSVPFVSLNTRSQVVTYNDQRN
jgi:hypothetical protein